ncbi:hypothetical protein [Caulobacter soli]|uniref:hypothetical protein n=1 Tax=Caulobacter soli TaxID=2708539 RepID=UPI0013EE343F|nr:hypothetical protein [Caulobacter soli]
MPALVGARRPALLTPQKSNLKLLNIGTRGEWPTVRIQSANTSYESFRGRVKLAIPVACKRFKTVDVGFYVNVAEVALGNDVAAEFAIEIPTAPITTPQRVRYGGSTSTIIPDGAAEHTSDWIEASWFGLTEFPAGLEYWRRWDMRVPQGGWYLQPTVNSSLINGEGSTFVAAATASTLLSTGATYGSGNYSHVPVMVLAEVPASTISVWGDGDSIMILSNDNFGDGSGNGGGWFRRGLYSVNGARIPNTNAGRGSTQISHFVASHSKRAQLWKYTNRRVSHYGTNDFVSGARTAAAIFADHVAMAREYKLSVPGGKNTISAILPRANTSDAGATVAGQTFPGVLSVFAAGGIGRDPLNALLQGAVGGGWIDEFMDLSPAIADATFPDRWKAPGYTIDAIHPSAGTASAAMGATFNAVAAAWPAAA